MIKYFLAVALLFAISNIFSQETLNYKFEGYCGNIKLRDIDAEYGELAFVNYVAMTLGTGLKRFVFDYGQKYKKDKEILVSNDKGEEITFSSIAMALNFMDYNGWNYVDKLPMDKGLYILLFRKKKVN
jgi:hypothetical protein